MSKVLNCRKTMVVALFQACTLVCLLFTGAGAQNLALEKTAVASSQEDAYLPAYAVDGKSNTRWSSAFTENAWLYVDFGKVQSVNVVAISWETASAASYDLQVALADPQIESSWTTIKSMSSMSSGARKDSITNLNNSGRYIRMKGLSRSCPYGYSIFEFAVYGSDQVLPLAGGTMTGNIAMNGNSIAGAATVSTVNLSASGTITANTITANTINGTAVNGQTITAANTVSGTTVNAQSVNATGMVTAGSFAGNGTAVYGVDATRLGGLTSNEIIEAAALPAPAEKTYYQVTGDFSMGANEYGKDLILAIPAGKIFIVERISMAATSPQGSNQNFYGDLTTFSGPQGNKTLNSYYFFCNDPHTFVGNGMVDISICNQEFSAMAPGSYMQLILSRNPYSGTAYAHVTFFGHLINQ